LTLDGMETRVGLLQKGATQEEQMVAAEQTNQAVEALFKTYGTTGSHMRLSAPITKSKSKPGWKPIQTGSRMKPI